MQKFVGLGADVGEKIGGLLRTWIRLQPCQFAHHLLKVGQRLVHIRMGIRINPRHGGLDLVSRYLGTRYFAGRDFASWLRRRESLRGCRLDLALVVQRSVSDFLPPWVPGVPGAVQANTRHVLWAEPATGAEPPGSRFLIDRIPLEVDA